MYVHRNIYYVMSVCLYVCFEETRISPSLKHTSILRLIYSPVGSGYKGVQNQQATLQRAVGLPADLCGTNGGSCHFHCTVPSALCDAGVCLCLFLLLNVVYLAIYAKLWLIVGMTTQMSNGMEVDIANY